MSQCPARALYARYGDRVTGKCVKARYVAEQHEIAARYAEWDSSAAQGPEVDPYARISRCG